MKNLKKLKLTAGILLVYTQDKIFWQNKQQKRKTPYSTPVLLIFLSCREEIGLMDALKCWLNPYSFHVLFSNNFSKWVIFGYGEICVQYRYIIPLSALLQCKTCIEFASYVLLKADIEQLTVNEVKCSKCNISSLGLNLFL